MTLLDPTERLHPKHTQIIIIIYKSLMQVRTTTWDGLCQVEEAKVGLFKSQLEAMKYAVEM
jgi:hypothetical protein